ncbi:MULTISPECIES: ATP-binding cassette domain-containing protein [Photorhabdus]|uniref:ATP-binding cassette domain-containing protein n=1 Tax=Photorhabdus TaxID=29487 RepID=UPI000DCD5081|nr:ATP-binding cassette domain-containing protein [Photorhabdus kleinii]RAW94169.1 hypothetical protein CKY03_20690 [Photorhabdus sp. S9-53]RAW94316.1 hypothetical protein CKY05_20480 [Photorhabdus sp. S10-54]RAW97946.1 hypothetical protein CKY04_20370 [Photorhabdus sp. S8-52]
MLDGENGSGKSTLTNIISGLYSNFLGEISSSINSEKILYTRYLSSCLFVGCTHSPRSHSYLCSRGFAPLPSRCNLKSIGYIFLKTLDLYPSR